MNLYYKILVMMFLNGAAAGVSLLVLGREISCQAFAGVNFYVSIAAAWAAGALAASVLKSRLKKAEAPGLNITISFSAMAALFFSLGSIFLIRYYRVLLGAGPDLPLQPAAVILLPVIVFLPLAAVSFTSLAAAGALAAGNKEAKPGLIAAMTAAGAAAGAVMYLLFLRRYYTNVDVLYATGILVLAATYMLFRGKTLEARWTMLAVIGAAILYLGFNVGGFKEKADRASSRAVYKGFSILAEKEYPTIKFVMAKKDGIIYVYENGSLTYKIPDEKYAVMAELARDGKAIIVNGGAAGLIEALKNRKDIREIDAYEHDGYTSYIMEKLMDQNILKGKKVKFLAGAGPGGIVPAMESLLASTVFINPRPAGPAPYSEKNLRLLEKNMAAGAKLVINAPESEKEAVIKAVRAVFGGSAEEKGFITAVKSGK